MYNFNFYKKSSIYCSFIIVLALQLILSYINIWYLHLSLSMMFMMYWTIITPNQVNIGTGFIIGLITDCILGSILGIHALSFSVISYITTKKLYILKNISVFQQIFFVICFSFIDKSLKLLITLLVTKFLVAAEFFWSCILDGLIWPFLLYVMRKLYKK